ncbi:Receptor-like protein kinase [Dichanthelium oligosanthes]|uniref:Receptor-like protein kinase n=1 Tax=Dichanthelium oligosanthes TaxID=888268 RepID=A0A1E5VLM0_9POAL|nr:Receptor-like protein kinase [Dichanthelium oligosanthes]
MAARSWLLLLCLAAVATTGVLQARAQPDSIGFISIDCGLPGTASYVDDTTKLTYSPDAAFIDGAGSNHNISAEYITPKLGKRYLNVRSFPDGGARSCYTLRSLEAGLKYLVRATFMYGNYDGLRRPPVFDLYVGVNFWTMVNVTAADSPLIPEAIILVPGDSLQVCLVNTGAGTPFISGLDLRPLKSTLYPQANETQGLVLLGRMNFGPTDITDIVRYPDDPHDRFWLPWVDATSWDSISTTKNVQNIDSDLFEAPSKVMQTAITPRNGSGNIEFYWDPEPQPKDPTPGYIGIMHFSELQLLPSNAVRQFYINLNGKLWYPKAFTPEYLYTDATYNSNPYRGVARYNISINATANSTLPPIINAVEVFSVISTANVGTDSQDGTANNSVKPQNLTPMSHVPTGDAYPQSSLQLENRRFTYKELEMITNNFQRVLGQGGFGKVYDGFLEDGTQVAVKLRSESSNQGVKEFLAEAQTLTRIHHKNLVSMVGYCKDGEYMALVYEYMSEGTLQEHVLGNGRNGRYLSWAQRLRIALESAQGLEYLHRGCNPPLIHRDVKGANILLNSKLEAKIADFGLTKAFNRENGTQVSTNSLVGTHGYVDPEYYATGKPTTKSDVYSFGVVVLQVVTGRPAVLRDPEPTSIIQWSRQRLARGNIEGVVDPRMRGDHDVNGVWKAADIALKCTAQSSAQRPTMTDVVAQLQECLELEEARARAGGGAANGGFYNTGGSSGSDPYSGYNGYTADGQSTDVSQSSTAFEMEHNLGRAPTMPTGPAAR